jgi:Fe-Mn family superoxide dismutase
MELQMRELPFDPASLHGLSQRLVESHHRNNYGGAVRRLNAIRARLAAMAFETAPGYELNGLKREELIATNSMLLHELYFAGLGGDGVTMAPAWELALAASFGSVQRWRDEFTAMGKALGGGSGWVLLTFQPRDGTLVNQRAADHAQAIAGGVPLLALDMYEHAYHLDHGAAAGAYVDAFMANIDWAAAYARYRAAVAAAAEGLAVGADDIAGAELIDVRRAGAYSQGDTKIAGAQWRDPATIGLWAGELAPDWPAVVYCVYGHEVSQAAALRLRAQGVPARFLRDGIEQWTAAGRPLQPKSAA